MLKRTRTLTLLLALLASQSMAAGKIKLNELSYDFGHIGIDYNVFHTFAVYNIGATPLTIKSVKPSCDCSSTSIVSMTIPPNDSTTIRLKFNTRNWSGTTEQYFTVVSDDPQNPTIDIPYHSYVGQYLRGTVPNPKSLFFLPGQKEKEIRILSSRFDECKMTLVDQADPYFKVEIVNGEADKDETLIIKVTPIEPISVGPHDSNFLIKIETPDYQKPILITIPVKIVRY